MSTTRIPPATKECQPRYADCPLCHRPLAVSLERREGDGVKWPYLICSSWGHKLRLTEEEYRAFIDERARILHSPTFANVEAIVNGCCPECGYGFDIADPWGKGDSFVVCCNPNGGWRHVRTRIPNWLALEYDELVRLMETEFETYELAEVEE